MAQGAFLQKLTSPTVHLFKMLIFLVVIILVGTVLYQTLIEAFRANIFLNGLIVIVLLIGIGLTFRQVISLGPEIRWVNALQQPAHPNKVMRPPRLLGPMARIMRGKVDDVSITPTNMRTILDSVAIRLEEERETTRYMTGLLVFLGLLGTFFGLLQTVSSIGDVINNLDVGGGDTGVLFGSLKTGLSQPLAGMGTAFASSLFGLAGSLILGFIDLQASQAQNMFYTELEDWMSNMTELDNPFAQISNGQNNQDLEQLIDKLGDSATAGGSNHNAILAMAELAKGVDGLVKHIRAEQEDMRAHIQEQSALNESTRQLIQALLDETGADDGYEDDEEEPFEPVNEDQGLPPIVAKATSGPSAPISARPTKTAETEKDIPALQKEVDERISTIANLNPDQKD